VGAYQVAVDATGNLFIAGYSQVRKVSTSGIITTVAGNGTGGFSGDGGPATNARLYAFNVAVDGSGNFFITDDFRIRKVSTSGIITTVAGNGTGGFSGDGGTAMNARLDLPQGIAVDSAGNLFIADNQNHRVRKVSTSGIITTLPGTVGLAGPTGIAVDDAGNLFIVDNYRVKKVSPNGTITTVAGNGTDGFSGDGGPATNAPLTATSVAVDRAGNLFIADFYNYRVSRNAALKSRVLIRTTRPNRGRVSWHAKEGHSAPPAKSRKLPAGDAGALANHDSRWRAALCHGHHLRGHGVTT
jgi:trimeric autotransporter adhesin